MIISEEKGRGGERAEKGWCMTPVEEGRNQYRARVGYVEQNTRRSARQTGTQANCTGDVIRQIGGHPIVEGQHSTRGLANGASRILDGQTGTSYNQTERNLIGRLANDASRISDGWPGTPCNQAERNLIGQTVKLNSGGNRAGQKKYKLFARPQ